MRSESVQWELFRTEAQKLGVPLDHEALGRFRLYWEELRQWNRTVRLVSKADLTSVLWLHFLDSLSVLPLIDPQRPLLDVGSGAGFPGVPLKIAAPELRVDLMEPRRRKANFLRHLIRTLGLEDIHVHQLRLEQGGTELGRFPTVVARALAPPVLWLKWATGVLAGGGSLLLMLGQRQEVEQVEPALRQLGWEVSEQRQLRLPVVDRRRSIVVLKRGPCFT